MLDRPTAPSPQRDAFSGRSAGLIAAILFAAVLLFAILISLRYAHGADYLLSIGSAWL